MTTMEVFNSKWMIAVLVIVVILAMLYFFGRKSVHTQVMIEATPDEVWQVLTDVPRIKEWNEVLIPLEGTLQEGQVVKYEFRQDADNTSQMSATVRKVVEGELLNQSGGMPGILTFDHRYILEAAEGRTRIVIHEDYKGIMVPFWNPAPVEKAYVRLLNALKDRVIELKGVSDSHNAQ